MEASWDLRCLRWEGRMTTTEKGRIVREGMGGFLNPPEHPEHTFSVETDLRRKPENRGMMSLSAAVDSDWLDPVTRVKAYRLLQAWRESRINLHMSDVREWIHQVLGYFRNCYKGQAGDQEWYAGELRISADTDPILSADLHAGVHLIRKYYPEYTPVKADFDGAFWGTKGA